MDAEMLLKELAQTLKEVEDGGDWRAHLMAWCGLVLGEWSPEDYVVEAADGPRLLSPQEQWAVARALTTGAVRTRELADAHHVCTETARLVLVRMAEDGLLEPHGTQKGRWYSPTFRVGGGRRAVAA